MTTVLISLLYVCCAQDNYMIIRSRHSINQTELPTKNYVGNSIRCLFFSFLFCEWLYVHILDLRTYRCLVKSWDTDDG